MFNPNSGFPGSWFYKYIFCDFLNGKLDNIQWTKHTTISGSGKITYPENCSEVMFISAVDGTNYVSGIFPLTVLQNAKWYDYGNGDYRVEIHTTNTYSGYIAFAKNPSDADKTSTTVTDVYYK